MLIFSYDGMLGTSVIQTVRSCAADGHTHICEFVWDNSMSRWLDDTNNLVQRTSLGEDCMGGEYTKKGPDYILFSKSFTMDDKEEKDIRFVAFRSAREKQRFVKAFGNFIINQEPFTSSFSIPHS